MVGHQVGINLRISQQRQICMHAIKKPWLKKEQYLNKRRGHFRSNLSTRTCEHPFPVISLFNFYVGSSRPPPIRCNLIRRWTFTVSRAGDNKVFWYLSSSSFFPIPQRKVGDGQDINITTQSRCSFILYTARKEAHKCTAAAYSVWEQTSFFLPRSILKMITYIQAPLKKDFFFKRKLKLGGKKIIIFISAYSFHLKIALLLFLFSERTLGSSFDVIEPKMPTHAEIFLFARFFHW